MARIMNMTLVMWNPQHDRNLPLVLLCLLVAACGGRRPPLPDVSGALPDAVLRAALSPEDGSAAPAVQPLLLDSVSFARLGEAAGGAAFAQSDLQRLIGRPFTAVSARDVLLCPDREPCRVAADAVYVEVWEAQRTGNELEAVVTRVSNVRDLYVMTHSVTHRIALRQEGGAWRLIRRERLPT
jgi:hypothetical protein